MLIANEDNEASLDIHSKDLTVFPKIFSDSIKLWLNEFYIHQLQENVTEPTDGKMGRWRNFVQCPKDLLSGHIRRVRQMAKKAQM
ncbi:MAG: hypothetical protein ACFKPT_06535 [Gloeotrichia echinulata GP01]